MDKTKVKVILNGQTSEPIEADVKQVSKGVYEYTFKAPDNLKSAKVGDKVTFDVDSEAWP